MRTTTTTILGTAGLALIGATLFAAPANAATAAETAAPTAAVQAEQGDRLIGKFMMDGRMYSPVSYGGGIPGAETGGDDSTWTFPAAGTTGPIQVADRDQCLSAQLVTSNEHALLVLPCNAADRQNWTHTDGGLFTLEANNDLWLGVVKYPNLDRYAARAVFEASAVPVDESVLVPVPGDGDGGDEDGTVPVPTVDTIDNSTGSTVIGGTGVRGATIEIRDEDGTVVGTGTGTVDPDGNWSVDLGKDMSQTPENLDVVQVIGDKESEPVRIDAANLPIIAPAIAAGAGILALAGLGGTIRRRRRNA